jgi:hypothetical protein
MKILGLVLLLAVSSSVNALCPISKEDILNAPAAQQCGAAGTDAEYHACLASLRLADGGI